MQLHQPEGVPALALTGERTLPDVPAENYWFRRHLLVYEWIAEQVDGLSVIDMACGEGYGCEVLSRHARTVIGVEANPEAYEHARLRYRRANIAFECDLVERFSARAEAITFLQTIEHLRDPGPVLRHFSGLVGGEGAIYISTPNVRTLAPAGAERSDNPWHVHEYTAEEFAALCASHFTCVRMFGLFHARKLRVHEVALRLGWDALHRRLGLTERFYAWFTPAISAADFRLKGSDEADLNRALDFVAVCRP